jgi:hypothetical protein
MPKKIKGGEQNMIKILLVVFALMFFVGVGSVNAETTVVRPEVDMRVTGDALGFAGGASVGPFAYDLLYTDLKYVVMANDKQDNKLQLGLALNVIEVVNKGMKTDFDTKNLSLRLGLAADLFDNLNIKYFAGAFWRF